MATANVSQIPLFSDPKFGYTVALENVSRVINFSWNDRTSSWHFDLFHEDGTEIISGVALVPNYPILADYALQDKDITGYFLLLDKGDFVSNKLGTSPEALAQWYELFYIFVTEDEE